MKTKEITNLTIHDFLKDYVKTNIKYNNKNNKEIIKIFLSVDRLTLVFPCPPTSEFIFFNEAIDNKINSEYNKNEISRLDEQQADFQIIDDDKGFYHYNRKIVKGNQDTFFLSWGYKNFKKDEDGFIDETSNNIRIDFNPNKIDLDSLKFIFSLIHPMSFKSRKITRIDYAIDYTLNFDFSSVNDLYVRSGSMYFKDGEGISTLYLGSKQSARQLRFYNKHLELNDKFKIKLDTQLTRIECQIRKNWDEFGTKNPFDSLDTKKFTVCDDVELSSCVKEIREIGLKAYLGRFKDKDKKYRFKKKVVPYLEMDKIIIHPKLIFEQCSKPCLAALNEKILNTYMSVKGAEYKRYENLKKGMY